MAKDLWGKFGSIAGVTFWGNNWPGIVPDFNRAIKKYYIFYDNVDTFCPNYSDAVGRHRNWLFIYIWLAYLSF